MILTPHIVVGAAIGAKTRNLGLIIILGILSHIILDKIPHWDYVVPSIHGLLGVGSLKILILDLAKVVVDAIIGLLIVFSISWRKDFLNSYYLPFILLGIFFSLLPDLILVFAFNFESFGFSQIYLYLHENFLHFKSIEKEGTITFFNLTTQIITVIVAGLFLSRLNKIPKKFSYNSSKRNS